MTLAEFPSLQRAQSTLPFLIAALALALAVLFPLLPPFALRACADTLFAAMIFHGVLAAGYPLFHTLAIAALSFAQAGIFQSATDKAGSIWLGLAVYCVASAAANFVRYRDARRVMALGAALSLAQLLDPMGPVLAVFLLPVCVGVPRAGEAAHKAGLLALLLFMPVVTAMVLAYARGVLGINPMRIASVTRPLAEHMPLYFLLLVGFAGAPVLWLTMFVNAVRRADGLIAVYAGLVVLVATMLAYLLGTGRDMASVLTATGAASVAALCAWPRAARNADLALAAMALAAVVSWLLVNLPSTVT
jgi:hypothetical protein